MPFRQANVVSVIGASEIWLFQCNFLQYPWPMIALVLALATAVFRNYFLQIFWPMIVLVLALTTAVFLFGR